MFEYLYILARMFVFGLLTLVGTIVFGALAGLFAAIAVKVYRFFTD